MLVVLQFGELPQPEPTTPCMYNTLLQESEVRWSTTGNGTAHRLYIDGCPLRRYSLQDARQCLSGKRLVFVGDSLTRYQYIVLVYWLERGKWPAPMGGVPGQPSPANKHEWER